MAIGNYALSGAHGNITENLGIGAGTLNSLNGAASNTAVGAWTGEMITTGSGNTLIGDRVGYAPSGVSPVNGLTTGSDNTFIGTYAGLASPTQQSNSTAIGYGAQVGGNKSVAIGYLAQVSADNAIVLGQVGATPPINVGIGTTTPQANLHVNGTARFEQRVRLAPQGDIDMGLFTHEP